MLRTAQVLTNDACLRGSDGLVVGDAMLGHSRGAKHNRAPSSCHHALDCGLENVEAAVQVDLHHLPSARVCTPFNPVLAGCITEQPPLPCASASLLGERLSVSYEHYSLVRKPQTCFTRLRAENVKPTPHRELAPVFNQGPSIQGIAAVPRISPNSTGKDAATPSYLIKLSFRGGMCRSEHDGPCAVGNP